MNLIKKIKEKKMNCVIISPHQDDALLSCAGLMSVLDGEVNITVVNVFTAADRKPYTLSAKKFLKVSGYTDASELYKEREEEDKKALSTFKISVINLGLSDALFRKKKNASFAGKLLPEFDHIYPTYRWHILKSLAKNDPAFQVLKKKLVSFNKTNTIFFAPFGIGNHADHVIVRKVCEEIHTNLVLYSDFPYNSRINKSEKSAFGAREFQLLPDLKRKCILLKMYKTQFQGLFPNGRVPKHNEVYYLPKEL
jgi:LmbE family N-acetylglucosaminyl deacetylase